MAEEYQEEEGAETDEAAVEAAPAKSKTGMLLILVIGVLIVVVGAIAAFFILKSTSGSGSKAATEVPEVAAQPVEEPKGVPILFKVGDVYVNIQGTRSTRVLKFTPYLEVSEPKMKDALLDFGPLLKDRIASVARSMTFDELEGPKGSELLKQEIRDTLNRSLRNRLSGSIVAVHFDDFLIQ